MLVTQGEPIFVQLSAKANFVLYVEKPMFDLYSAYALGDRTESAVNAYQLIAGAVEKMHLAGLIAGLDMPQAVSIQEEEAPEPPNVARGRVFDAIDGERQYQLGLWGDNPHSITEFLAYIRDYTEEALHDCCRLADKVANPKALDTVRKVAALAVACMEQHGARQRDLNDLKTAYAEHKVK